MYTLGLSLARSLPRYQVACANMCEPFFRVHGGKASIDCECVNDIQSLSNGWMDAYPRARTRIDMKDKTRRAGAFQPRPIAVLRASELIVVVARAVDDDIVCMRLTPFVDS